MESDTRVVDRGIGVIKVRVHASKIRLGDQLISADGRPRQLLMQLHTRGEEVRLTHPSSETRLTGNPWVWVLRTEPRVIVEELPATIWHRRGPRRIQPWEGAQRP